MAHALRSTKLLKTFSKDLLKAKGEGGTWLTVVNFLVVRSFALEVRSWSGNDVPISFYQTNIILCSDRKGPGSKVQLSPSALWSWLTGGRFQLVAPSGPGPQTLPSRHH